MHLESLFSLFMEILDVSGKPIVPCYGNGAPTSSEQVITREGLPGRAAEAPAEAQGNAASAPVSVPNATGCGRRASEVFLRVLLFPLQFSFVLLIPRLPGGRASGGEK